MSDSDNKSKVWNALSDSEFDDLDSFKLNAVSVGFILDEIIERELNKEDDNGKTE